VSGETSPQ